MVKSLYCQFQLNFAQNTNRLIYSIINLPFLRGQISQEWYVRRDIKKVFGILSLLGNALGDILQKFFYFAGVIWLPQFLMMGWLRPTDFDGTLGKSVLWAFFILNCMLGSFMNSYIVHDGDEAEYLLLNLMNIDPREYYLSGICWEYGKQTVYYSIALLVCVRGFLHCPMRLVLWIIGCYICFRSIGETVRLKLCERYGIPFQEHNKPAARWSYLYIFIMVLTAYGTYPVLYFLQGKTKHIFHPLFDSGVAGSTAMLLILVVAAVGAFLSINYLRGYPDYLLVARRMCNQNRMQEAKDTQETLKNAAIRAEELSEEANTGERLFPEKSGYDYLHAIFFYRHKKLVGQNLMVKIIISGVFFAVTAVVLVVANFSLSSREFMEMSGKCWGKINNFLSIVVFLMYCFSSGKDLTCAMFYNCDISLLKYGYYRSREAILMSFRIRLKYMLKTQIPMVAVLCAGVLVDCLLLRQYTHWGQILAILCCVCILTVFFSVTFLCMYYIFQPFTEGGKETGFGYKLCTWGLYGLAYTCLQIHTPPVHFAGLVLGITLFVIVAAVALVWWLAPKTFHLK